MMKRFCSNCETFHDGPCSAAALARAGKGGKKRKDGDSDTPNRRPIPRSANIAPPLTADVPAGAKHVAPIVARAIEDVADGQMMTVDLGAKTAVAGDRYWQDRYEALLARIEAEKQSNRERVQKHRAAKAKKKRGKKVTP